MAYPPEMPISEWLKPQDIVRYIEFTERVGSLAERGIDEMQRREESGYDQLRQRMTDSMYQQYEEYSRMNPGGTIRIPRMQEVRWNEVSDGVYGADFAQEYDEISRADLEAMAGMPQVAIHNDFWVDSDTSILPMTSA